LQRKNGETPLVATPRHALGHALDSSIAGLVTGPSRSTDARMPGFRAWLRSGLVLGVAASACVGLAILPGTAAATPTPADITRLVADASHQLEVISEQVNTARTQFDQQKAAADQADQAAVEAKSRLDAMQGQVRQIARTVYTTGDVSRLDVLLSSKSAKDFVAQMGTLDEIAGHQTAVLDQATSRAKAAAKAQAKADAAAAAAKKTLDAITTKQGQLQSQISDYQKQYAALTAPQQQAVSRVTAGQAVAAAPVAAPVAASSQAAAIAVQTALAQVGKPYVWGASGPGSFDCSGLTMYSYAAAGVALPHSSSGQSTMGTPVSRSQLQPGDLVFFYSPVSHVGMYIGNGQMVHASTSGTPVQVVNLDSMPDYNSARRIAG
jgi:cell wall-associated NlpC family hydrolase